MQHRQGNALATAIVTYLIFVVIFALFDPFRNSGLWVYGMSAVATAFCIGKVNSQPAKKPAPKKPPAGVALDPRLARAQKVWAAEKELGMIPSEIFGYRPHEPPRVIRKVPLLEKK